MVSFICVRTKITLILLGFYNQNHRKPVALLLLLLRPLSAKFTFGGKRWAKCPPQELEVRGWE